MNPRRNRILKNVWIEEHELRNLIECLDGNYQDEAFKIIFEIYKRGDFLV